MPKLAGKRSDVWSFFRTQGNQACICNLCGRVYKTGGGTTNLKNYILHEHPSCLNNNNKENCMKTGAGESEAPRKKLKISDSDTADTEKNDMQETGQPADRDVDPESHLQETNDTCSSSFSSSRTSSWIQRQPTIEDTLKLKRSYEFGGSKDAAVTQALLFTVCKDNYPLNCTQKEGFERFLKVAVPLYTPPSRSTLTRALEQKYISLKKVVSLKLLAATHISLTTDIATVMNATRSFIVLTSHFIDDEKNAIASIALGVKNLTQHHTGDNICHDLQEMLEGWNIPRERIVSITTDNGANIVSGVKKLTEGHRSAGFDVHVSCFAHNINLVVSKSLGCKEVEGAVQIIDKVRPFEAATKTISGEKYVSGSLVIPLINCVKTSLQRITNTNVLCQCLKNELTRQIEKRLDPLERNVLLSAATILDPRFKRIHFSSPLNAASAISAIKNEVRKEFRLQGSLSPPVDQCQEAGNLHENATECNIWSIHDEVALKNMPDSESSEGLPTELKLYLNQSIQPRNRDPIQYWTESKFAFPATYKVAMRFLTVLGASVASERLVSTLNNVCSDSRSRLTPSHTNELVFLNSLDYEYWNM